MLISQWNQRCLAVSLLSLCAQPIFAATDASSTDDTNGFYPNVITVSAGAGWEHAGNTQTFYLTPSIIKTYDADNSNNSFADVEIYLANQWRLPHQLRGQFGFAFSTTSDAKLTGNIWDDADPQFNNYNYSYKIQHTAILAKAKLLADFNTFVTPWISVGAGLGINRAHSFNNSPTIFEAVPNANFSSYYQNTFTYTLGAGVEKAINKNWLIGVGYEFSNWGRTDLGSASGQTMGGGLTLNHFYTNNVLMNLTYLS